MFKTELSKILALFIAFLCLNSQAFGQGVQIDMTRYDNIHYVGNAIGTIFFWTGTVLGIASIPMAIIKRKLWMLLGLLLGFVLMVLGAWLPWVFDAQANQKYLEDQGLNVAIEAINTRQNGAQEYLIKAIAASRAPYQVIASLTREAERCFNAENKTNYSEALLFCEQAQKLINQHPEIRASESEIHQSGENYQLWMAGIAKARLPYFISVLKFKLGQGTPDDARTILKNKSIHDKFSNYIQGYYAIRQEEAPKLLSKAQFLELNKDYIRAKLDNTPYINGFSALDGFYTRVSEPENPSRADERDWLNHQNKLMAWIEHEPKSFPAKLALSEFKLKFALAKLKLKEASTDFDNTYKTISQFKGLSEERCKNKIAAQTQSAAQDFAAAQALAAPDAHFFELAGILSMCGALPRNSYDQLIQQAYKTFPNAESIYFRRAQYLLPQYCGKAGELETFLSTFAKGKDDNTMIARVLWFLDHNNLLASTVELSDPALWTAIKTSFEELRKLDREDTSVSLEFIRVAALLNHTDKETLALAFGNPHTPTEAIEAAQAEGQTLYSKNKWKEASEKFTTALQLAEKVPDTDYNKAIAYCFRSYANLNLERFPPALVDAEKALEIDPKYSSALFAKGFSECEMKEIPKGIQDIYESLHNSRTPAVGSNQQYQRILEHCYASLRSNRQQNAEQKTKTLELAADLESNLGHHEKAAEALTGLISVRKSESPAKRTQLHSRRAEEYLASGQVTKALDDANLALSSSPNELKIHLLKSRIYRMKGDLNSANEEFHKGRPPGIGTVRVGNQANTGALLNIVTNAIELILLISGFVLLIKSIMDALKKKDSAKRTLVFAIICLIAGLCVPVVGNWIITTLQDFDIIS